MAYGASQALVMQTQRATQALFQASNFLRTMCSDSTNSVGLLSDSNNCNDGAEAITLRLRCLSLGFLQTSLHSLDRNCAPMMTH